MFCDSLSAMGAPCGHFNLKIAELSCNQLLSCSPPPPTLHPYISACGVDKKLSKKWQKNQLVMTLNNYSYVANCKPAALGLLEILRFEILCFSTQLTLCITGGFSQSQLHILNYSIS